MARAPGRPRIGYDKELSDVLSTWAALGGPRRCSFDRAVKATINDDYVRARNVLVPSLRGSVRKEARLRGVDLLAREVEDEMQLRLWLRRFPPLTVPSATDHLTVPSAAYRQLWRQRIDQAERLREQHHRWFRLVEGYPHWLSMEWRISDIGFVYARVDRYLKRLLNKMRKNPT
jgi:hypothetical protein